MNDPAQDENGETYPNVESGGAPFLIRDSEDYRNMRQKETEDANLKTPASPVCGIYLPSIHGSNLLIKIC